MALAQLMLIPPPPPACCCCCYLDEQRNLGSRVLISLFSSRNGVYRVPGRYSTVKANRDRRRRNFVVEGRGRLSVTELQRSVENSGQIRTVEIPVTCYQIIGLTHQAEKDQIAKSVIRLENEPVKEGYTLDVVESRKKLLLDVRDKLFFEQEYAGNVREKVPPKSSLRIPWSWLPGALCLLEEVGEMKLVLEIGEAALQLSDAKPYVHDMLFSMALAECAIAKSWIDKSKVSQGFEALEHAQYLLTRIDSLRKVPLLSEIEEDLEMYCPVYILEVLGMPHAPQNADRRRRVIAILQLLLLQGLDGETSSSVHDWTSFLDQALIKLLATEIVDLLHWSDLAVTRKNKQSIESQNLRAVIDLNCFCKAMKAHIAVGFSSRQTDLINKAKIICECLVASDGMNLKFEEALCSFLLGQGGEAAAAERLQELEMSSGAASRNIMSSFPEKERNGSSHQSLEKWLKDFVLSSFPDTCDCSPSLANFFRGDKRNLGSKSNKQNIGAPKTVHTVRHRPSTFVLSTDHNGGSEGPFPYSNSTRQLGVAFKQLAPADLQSPLMAGKTSSGSNSTVPSVQLKRNFGAQHKNMWRGWSFPGDVVQRITFITVLGCLVFTTVKLFDMQFGHVRRLARLDSLNMKTNKNSLAWTMDPSLNQKKALPACIRPSNIGQEIRRFMASVKNLKHHSVKQGTQGSLLADDLMTFTEPAHTRVMPVEEAESLVKQWQTVKAEALGPDHEVQNLPEVLAESMLAEWHDLADSAKARSCFWRFVLLRLSVLRADILSDGVGAEMAEIEALLEEAAELVDESQPKNPNYYSTYKIRYVLKRQSDGSWRFCGWGIQAPT